MLCQDPLGGPVSPTTLAVATACLNARIRSRGLSAREMWSQRDQFSNIQIPMTDQYLIVKQHDQRIANHPRHSELSKTPLHRCALSTLSKSGIWFIFSLIVTSHELEISTWLFPLTACFVTSESSLVHSYVAIPIELKSQSATEFLLKFWTLACSHPSVPSNDDSSGAPLLRRIYQKLSRFLQR